MPLGLADDGREKGKKKKWWGELFKRRSRKVSSESSTEEDEVANVKRRGFLRRKKTDRGSKDVTNSFLINSTIGQSERGRSLESVKTNSSAEKRRIKKKVEQSRDKLAGDSSSDESSYTSSLPSAGSFPRRSRAARTERHNRRLWSASVVYQESNDYDTKFRAKARSATPSPAASPKVRQRAASQDSMAPPPPPRRIDVPKYTAPVYTAPALPKFKRYNGLSDPAIPKDWEDKPPAAPPRRMSEEKKRQAHLEEALNELEAIYKKLEDLQEPTRDETDVNAEPKAEDDMAYRRLNRRTPSTQDVRDIVSQAGSYLLVSPTLSPSPLHQIPPTGIEPDITFDDVVYRTMNHSNNTLKCLDPQPPFGIPVGPISPAPSSDYLHAHPMFEYKPPNTPDLVMDDLAFRNLRKDGQGLRKKKAVRSLSANLSSVIFRNNNDVNVVNNNLDGKSQSYSDIPEEMRLAQRVLDMRRDKYLKKKRDESEILKELEDEARATSLEIEQKLANNANYSRSMADLLEELTKNLDSDFGECQTCEGVPNRKQSAQPVPRSRGSMESPIRRKPWQSHLGTAVMAKSVEVQGSERVITRPKWNSVRDPKTEQPFWNQQHHQVALEKPSQRLWTSEELMARPWLKRQEEQRSLREMKTRPRRSTEDTTSPRTAWLQKFDEEQKSNNLLLHSHRTQPKEERQWSSVKLPSHDDSSPLGRRKEERPWSSVKFQEKGQVGKDPSRSSPQRQRTWIAEPVKEPIGLGGHENKSSHQWSPLLSQRRLEAFNGIVETNPPLLRKRQDSVRRNGTSPQFQRRNSQEPCLPRPGLSPQFLRKSMDAGHQYKPTNETRMSPLVARRNDWVIEDSTQCSVKRSPRLERRNDAGNWTSYNLERPTKLPVHEHPTNWRTQKLPFPEPSQKSSLVYSNEENPWIQDHSKIKPNENQPANSSPEKLNTMHWSQRPHSRGSAGSGDSPHYHHQSPKRSGLQQRPSSRTDRLTSDPDPTTNFRSTPRPLSRTDHAEPSESLQHLQRTQVSEPDRPSSRNRSSPRLTATEENLDPSCRRSPSLQVDEDRRKFWAQTHFNLPPPPQSNESLSEASAKVAELESGDSTGESMSWAPTVSNRLLSSNLICRRSPIDLDSIEAEATSNPYSTTSVSDDCRKTTHQQGPKSAPVNSNENLKM